MADANEVIHESKALLGQLGKERGPLLLGFRELSKAAMTDGELSKMQKELIAVALSVAAGCDRCIAHHVRGCLDNGATRGQVLEACSVAVMMGGGPSLMYTETVLEALDDLGAAKGG